MPKKLETFLEMSESKEATQSLTSFYRWGLNYNSPQNPFNLFLDIIGWSDEAFGTNLYEGDRVGYVEADMLADALKVYANTPEVVGVWVDQLFEMQMDDEEEGM